MRRNRLTLSLMAALLLSACAPNAQTDAPDTIAQAPVSAAAAPEALSVESTDILTEDSADLPQRYQGLDPIEITRAEIDELIILQKKVDQSQKASIDTLNAWSEQDRATRGPRPDWTQTPLPPQDNARLKILNSKLQNAEIRKKYETADPNVLTPAEVQEIIRLEQKQAKSLAEFQLKAEAWYKQDPATRGPKPVLDASSFWGEDPRLIELQAKFENTEKIGRMVSRVEEMSATYNIALSDSEMSELADLETEQQKFELEFSKALMEAEKESQLTGVEVSEEDIVRNFPKHLIQRMVDMEIRKQEIMAPLEAAKKADKVQTQLAELSAASGIPILSGEISESIALNAEKDKIQYQTELEAMRKWMAEGGPIPVGEPLPNNEDYARLKAIDARLKAISAPMMDAKQAAEEADNPALRESRLKQEAREKWHEDWRDKQQAGTVPPGTPMTSPSYAELQDRVDSYSATLRSRADRASYTVPEADIERLDTLNEEMLAIRKTVYEMEKDGSAHIKGKYGMMTSTSGTISNMYKIQLLKKKQDEILAGLLDTERLRSAATAETGTTQLRARDFSIDGNETSVEEMIEQYRRMGIEISDSDADDLRTFAQELQDR